jgi:hypothetical protein
MISHPEVIDETSYIYNLSIASAHNIKSGYLPTIELRQCSATRETELALG